MKTLRTPRIRDDNPDLPGPRIRPVEAMTPIGRRRVRRDLAIVTLRRQDRQVWSIAALADLFDMGRTRVVVILKSARDDGQDGGNLAP